MSSQAGPGGLTKHQGKNTSFCGSVNELTNVRDNILLYYLVYINKNEFTKFMELTI